MGIKTNVLAELAFASVLVFSATVSISLAADEIEFNRDIRPILAENCFYCHGQDANQRQADLRLDIQSDALEYEAIVPFDAAASLLVERISSDDAESVMPPPGSNRRLTAEQKKMLSQWISEGATYQSHWAFEAPIRGTEPATRRLDWARNGIDRFVLAKLESEGLSPSPEADRATLIKRLSIDLTGLPPSPEEVFAFQSDTSKQAYEILVDRLLSSPHYGERMSLPWLDAARYADSNGFQQDGDTWQWIWRDWVVQALNDDLPFDQFTIWQLAGDLLSNATTAQKIASGFNRNHLLNGEGGAIAEEQRFVNLFDRMNTTATTWLGLTMACAQCHDHKYDPISQRDYYRLMDAFNRVPETGTPQFFSKRIRVASPFIELPTEANKSRISELDSKIKSASKSAASVSSAAFLGWRSGIMVDGKPAAGKGLSDSLMAILKKPEKERTKQEVKSLETELKSHFEKTVQPKLVGKIPELAELNRLKKQLQNYRKDQIPRVMIMSDAQPRQTSILERGEYLKPTEKVTFGTPAFLPSMPDDAPANRLGLAYWLVSDEHPLTSRVQVNRMWQHFFGSGIVETVEDFGVQSEYPVHKDLLDWLAVEFRESGWSMKRLNRLIVTSATYRQSSQMSEEHRLKDSENRLYARASRFRMPSMLLRDWALATSGLLVEKIGGPPVYPYQPEAAWEALAITKERDFTYPSSVGDDLYRRSLYTFWRRTVSPANMFDASNRQACRVRASVTSTPLHALTTLNDPTWVEAARVLAERCWNTNSNIDDRLAAAFRRVVCRPPEKSDQLKIRKMYDRQLAIYRSDVDLARQLLAVGAAPRDESLDPSQHAALTVTCLGILNLDEALTRE